ncbi:MAG: hypothetical protein LBV69_04715 [Bacteroidales bacterium]|jgi:hypothetical protein|nr:hypothetical protein [Bacteroidales bacterium]
MKLINKLKLLKKAIVNSININQTINANNKILKVEFEKQLIKNQIKYNALYSSDIGITYQKYFKDKEVIISLTSYGIRCYDVYMAIESLLEQTIKPNKIILWLAEDEFSLDTIPQTLKNLLKRGLTIDFCKDIKQYKKLIPSLIKYPNDIIITTDDDILQSNDFLENLMNSYKKKSKNIHFCRGHKMKFKENRELDNYMNWNFCIKNLIPDRLNFFTGVGGVLYPPNSLYKDVVNEDFFMQLAPNADDVWFNAMAIKQGTISQKVYTHNYYGHEQDYIDIDNEAQCSTALFNINCTKNDEQIKAVFDRYNIYELLKDVLIK